MGGLQTDDKLKEKPTYSVFARCWATTSCQNSFSSPWHSFYKSLDGKLILPKDIPSIGILIMVLESAV